MARAALCVGINGFANLPMASWLNGCVNDAQDISRALRQQGFTTRNMTVLTDAQATKQAVMAELTELTDRARAGKLDRLVFSFSSHGTQIKDLDGDERDGVDEAFACHDIAQKGDQWDRDTVIVDDELHALFSGLPDSVLVEVLLDTCHSGTGLRDGDILQGRRPRYLPPPTIKGLDLVNRTRANRDVHGLIELTKTSRTGAHPVLFTACRSDQVASDAHFDGRSNGAFTYFFLKALAADGAAPRSALLTSVSGGLRGDSFNQRAQLEATAKAKKVGFGQTW
jgi:hypothetical protein